jgi:hypothetical protein
MFDLSSSLSKMIPGKPTGGGRRRGRGSRRRHRGGAGSMPAAPTTGAMAMPSSMTASIKDMMTNMPTMKGGNNALSPATVGGGRSRRLRLRSTRTRRRRSRSHRAGGGRKSRKYRR